MNKYIDLFKKVKFSIQKANIIKMHKACFFFSGTVFVIQLHEFFSEMDDRIFKIPNDSESEGFDTRRDEAFLANRISDIPEKTG